MHYEIQKHTDEHPIVGVITFRNPHSNPIPASIALARSAKAEKQGQLNRQRVFHARHAQEASAKLKRLQQVGIDNGNFAVLMDAARCSLGQITSAMFEVGGQYRRGM